MKKKITIHELAKALKIDSSTVSRALNNSNRVTQKTKDKVLLKAKELGYQRNVLASNLRMKKSNTIGVIVPRISRHFFSSAISGIEEVAFSFGYNVIISQSLEEVKREESIVENLIANQVDGLLVSVSMETTEGAHLKNIEQNTIPLVFFDRFCKALPHSSRVVIDDRLAAFEAVSHLIKKGCKKIVHLSGPQTLEIYKNRLQGYKEALKQHGLPYNEAYVVSSKLMESDGKKSIEKLITEDIDGVFSANDVAAIGAIKYLKSIGKKVPEDISVIGFSNEPISEVIEPSLTTIDQHGFEMGKKACELLIKMINKEVLKPEEKKMVIKPDLILRESTL